MQCAGFVLAGGGSRRMGRDKALLPWEGSTLVRSVAAKVLAATGSVSLIGNPDRHDGMGYPVLADLHPGFGPMGGLETALLSGSAKWNLLVACDMPRLTVETLRLLVSHTLTSPQERGCIVPATSDGWQPLCAVYHVSCLPVVERSMALKRLKMRDLIHELQTVEVALDGFVFSNVNTPGEWNAVRAIGS